MNPKRCIPVAGKLLACAWLLGCAACIPLRSQPAYARYRAGQGPADPKVLRIYLLDSQEPVLIAAAPGAAAGLVWWVYGPAGGELRLDPEAGTGIVYAGQQEFGLRRISPSEWLLTGLRDTARLAFGGEDLAAWGRLDLLRGASAGVPLIRYERPAHAGRIRAGYSGLLADYPEAFGWAAWLLAAREAERMAAAPRR